ncbi:hypothetical protein [Pseudogemmobacter faecipullorum]|uniref:Uncharacterized protein n=1 Tax=Pseudogemmobacter faecipullorum TaxID=2755041 RepID=A0ABS8CLJ7_9RHOB|nr:hypothetical protein [Pseudogemmobacter faecipullorum]MCB5410070.1 hypothetical protein [Pseudogemmobacter faecipullorum]
MAGFCHCLAPAVLLLGLAQSAGAAGLDCRAAEICEGGTDCQPAGEDALKLTLSGMGAAEATLERDGAALSMAQTRPAPIWRWSAGTDQGQTEILAFREADQAFTYLILEGGQTALKVIGQCEVL